MRVFFILFITAIVQFKGISQSMDTIELNINLAATLEFQDNIKEIIYGNNPVVNIVADKKIYKYYDEFRLDNKAVIAANGENIPFTTITVFLDNGDLYYGFITYSDKPKKNYYPFKNKKDRNIQKEDKTDQENIIKERLQSVMNSQQEYNDIAIVKSSLTFQVTNIKNDEFRTYVKIILNNESSGSFKLKGITFSHIEGKKKSLNKKEVSNEKRITPLYSNLPERNTIEAYTKKEFGYVIPLYTTAQGMLIIHCYEETGSRDLEIKINANKLANIKVF